MTYKKWQLKKQKREATFCKFHNIEGFEPSEFSILISINFHTLK